MLVARLEARLFKNASGHARVRQGTACALDQRLFLSTLFSVREKIVFLHVQTQNTERPPEAS